MDGGRTLISVGQQFSTSHNQYNNPSSFRYLSVIKEEGHQQPDPRQSVSLKDHHSHHPLSYQQPHQSRIASLPLRPVVKAYTTSYLLHQQESQVTRHPYHPNIIYHPAPASYKPEQLPIPKQHLRSSLSNPLSPPPANLKSMNINSSLSSTSYIPSTSVYGTSPQPGSMIPHLQQPADPCLLSSSYGSSPYSTSPYSPLLLTQKNYSTSPAPVGNSYMHKSLSDSNLNNVFTTDDYIKQPYQVDSVYQPSSNLQQPQQQQYAVSSSLPSDGSYYPYHKDLLNALTDTDVSPYSVKYTSGTVHQYPLPDYTSPPPEYSEKQQQQQNYYVKPGYPADINNTYLTNTSDGVGAAPDVLHAYNQHIPAYQSSPPTGQNFQQTQYPAIVNQIPGKHNGGVRHLHTSPLQSNDTAPYLAYRTTDLDSPQGSPLPVNQQSSGIFKTPQATPPTQRKNAPARQISNEVYNLDSPSSQLLLQDMSLNSPRPRSETVEMEPPPTLPPRSPLNKQDNGLSCNINPQKMMPPPSQIPIAYQVQNYIQPPHIDPGQRLRSGTVEMVDSVSVNSYKNNPNSIANQVPPSVVAAKYPNQLNVNIQRSRAGTVEMADPSQLVYPVDSLPYPMPERRIRSGTVEMSEAVPAQLQQQSQQQPVYPVSSTGQQFVIKSTERSHSPKLPYDEKNARSSTLPPPPPYPNTPPSQQPHTTDARNVKPVHTYQQPVTPVSSSSQPVQTVPSRDSSQANLQRTSPARQATSNQTVHQSSQPASPVYVQPQVLQYPQNVASPPPETTAKYRAPLVSGPSHLSHQNNSLPRGVEIIKGYPGNQPNVSAPQYNTVAENKCGANKEQRTETAQLSDQELERQQKLMQQQYIQRVRQAQLQQQLREIQTEYEANLRLEQDIAQEFLREQKEVNEKKPYQAAMTSQANRHQQQQLYQSKQLQGRQMNYTDPTLVAPAYMPTQAPLQQPQQIPSRMTYVGNDGSVFPVTGLPVNQTGYQHRMPSTVQAAPQSQPIVIMPGGGSFSNPGQFIPASTVPRKEQQSTTFQGKVTKQQTPFQKLRKIAEDISSFVDDVVKFKGKKGDHEYKYLEEMLTQQLLLLDKVAANTNDELRNARKSLVKEVQELLEILDRRSSQKSE